jgi:16S rRNA (guanine966-N2)-methyltransferase
MARRRRPRPAGSIRIIGGRWRGTRLPLAHDLQLRPSSDRVRETLFNWLAPGVEGAVCLDLFAGTGALGLEAISRGAKQLQLIDNDPDVVRRLTAATTRLAATNVAVTCVDALQWLADSSPQPYDIVFVDPPFGRGHIPKIVRLLESGWLAADAVVYLEGEKEFEPIKLPDCWEIYRQGRTRHVNYALVKRSVRANQTG